MTSTPDWFVAPTPEAAAAAAGRALRKLTIHDDRIGRTTQQAAQAEAKALEAHAIASSASAEIGTLKAQINALTGAVKLAGVIIGACGVIASCVAAYASHASSEDAQRQLEAQIQTLKTDIIRRDLEREHAPKLDWGKRAP